jgi:Flp pilus assembly protein TadG
MRIRQRKSKRFRRGAAAVEFALVAPIFVTIALGVSKTSQLFEVQNQLTTAVREGARLAAMDRTGLLSEGETTNAKVANDIKSYLTASGLSGSLAGVSIVDATNGITPFDLDDPANNLALFEVRIDLPYSSVTGTETAPADDWDLSASIVFRNGRATLSQ